MMEGAERANVLVFFSFDSGTWEFSGPLPHPIPVSAGVSIFSF